MAYKRVLLKLSGEALMGSQSFGLSPEMCRKVAVSLKELTHKKIQVGIVVGGGNIFRGVKGASTGMQRVPADQVGMLGTMINGLMLQQALMDIDCKAKVLSALHCEGVVEPYHWQKAVGYLEEGYVGIFVGGTGLPYFTTDTAAALRAVEIRAEVLLKATKVDGVYDKDPVKFKDAKRFETLTLSQMLEKNLSVMDAAATALCRDNRLPILVFDLFEEKSLEKAVFEKNFGTTVLPQ